MNFDDLLCQPTKLRSQENFDLVYRRRLFTSFGGIRNVIATLFNFDCFLRKLSKAKTTSLKNLEISEVLMKVRRWHRRQELDIDTFPYQLWLLMISDAISGKIRNVRLEAIDRVELIGRSLVLYVRNVLIKTNWEAW